MDDALIKMLLGQFPPQLLNLDHATAEQLFASLFGQSGASGGEPYGFMGASTSELQNPQPQIPNFPHPAGDYNSPQSLLQLLGLK